MNATNNNCSYELKVKFEHQEDNMIHLFLNSRNPRMELLQVIDLMYTTKSENIDKFNKMIFTIGRTEIIETGEEKDFYFLDDEVYVLADLVEFHKFREDVYLRKILSDIQDQ